MVRLEPENWLSVGLGLYIGRRTPRLGRALRESSPSMATAARINWVRVITQGVTAGIAGGLVFDLYLWLTTVLPAHGSILAMWQWMASAAIGKVAFASTSYASLGLLFHFIVSIGWAGGYAFLARTRPFMNERWAISGIVYGIIVYTFMQLLLLGTNSFTFPATPNAFVNLVIAHAVFFGLPVAFVVARLDRSA